MCGVLVSRVTDCACWVAGVSDTDRMKAAPASTSLRAAVADTSGLPWSSSTRSSTWRPSRPPRELSSLTAYTAPCATGSAYPLAGPTLSVIRPILMVCANAPGAINTIALATNERAEFRNVFFIRLVSL